MCADHTTAAGWFGVWLVAALVVLGSPPAARACSQCLCGTPFPSDVLGGVVPMQFRYGVEERYLSKSNGLDEGPGIESEREHRVSPFVLWRPGDRISLLGRVPYNVKEIRTAPAGEPTGTATSRGVGDADLTALVGLARPAAGRPLAIGLVLGATLPTGSNDVRDQSGERLDAHLQPGSGAWSGTAGITAALVLAHGTLDASAMGRANGSNAHGYRYGDVLLVNLGYLSPARHGWQLLAQINARSAARDRLEDGSRGLNTGGTVIYAAPGVRWEAASALGLEGAVQLPVYRSLLGQQDEHATGRFAITMGR